MKRVEVPWGAWYGEEPHELTFPQGREVLEVLSHHHGDGARVGVFPCGAMQLADDSPL